MAFTPEPTLTPESIGQIRIILIDQDGSLGGKGAQFELQVIRDDGSIRSRRGDLLPHITTAQRDALIAFMDGLRAQAIAQILGGGS